LTNFRIYEMITILQMKYDDGGSWYSSKKRLKQLLVDPLTPEMFIIYLDEKKEKDFCLLTDISNKEVIIGDETIKIPNPF
jgi:hypothetical protein